MANGVTCLCRGADWKTSVVDQPLRRDEDEPALHPAGCIRVRTCARSIDCELSSRTAGTPHARQAVDLVLHQRDQRRHDDRDAVSNEQPGPGSRATCRRRSAGRRGNRGHRGRPASPVPVVGGAKGIPSAARWRREVRWATRQRQSRCQSAIGGNHVLKCVYPTREPRPIPAWRVGRILPGGT